MVVVPKVIHQIWLGPTPLPEEFAHYQRTWIGHHPGWELRLWGEENLPRDLQRAEVYDTLRVPAERADILRLELLWRHGGVYVDTDFECLRSIEGLIDGADFFTAYLKPRRVNNAFLGARTGHPILERAIRDLRPRAFYGYDKAAAGPLFLDRLLRDYPDARIFEPPLFYPSTPAEQAGAYAIHHVARSWKDAEGFEVARLRAEGRIASAQAKLARSRQRRARLVAELAGLHARFGDDLAGERAER